MRLVLTLVCTRFTVPGDTEHFEIVLIAEAFDTVKYLAQV